MEEFLGALEGMRFSWDAGTTSVVAALGSLGGVVDIMVGSSCVDCEGGVGGCDNLEERVGKRLGGG